MAYKQELNRTLTFKDLLIYGMVFMVPIAPMGIYGFVAKESFGMVPLVYLVGIIAMIFTALSYSKMSKEFPVAGSVYSYVQRGWNPHIGFLAGWMILIDYILVPSLLYGFTGVWLHSLIPGVPIFVWIVVFIIFNSIINAMGVQIQSKVNFIFLAIEILAIILFIIFGIKYVFINGLGAGGFSIDPLFQPEHVDFKFVASAASIAVLSFLGFDGISTLAEETKNPRKTVGRATIAALVLLGVVFMLETYMAALIHPGYSDLDPDVAFFDITKQIGGNFLYIVILVVNVAATGLANAIVAQSAISRILYAMSRDRLLPFSGFLSKIHPKTRTPTNAILFVGILTLFVSLFLSVETLTKFVNFGALTSFMVLNITVFIYFFIKKKQRTFKGFINYLVLPLVGFLVIAYVWSGFDSVTLIVGFSWLALGLILGFVKTKGYKEAPAEIDM